MKALVCEHCGGDEFVEKDGYRTCMYCKSRFVITKDERKTTSAVINLNDDVARLLEKCKSDPARAKKYAKLVLEIAPGNSEAKAILYGMR